jgi:hypothetical protein
MLPVPITPARIWDDADDSLTTDEADGTDMQKAGYGVASGTRTLHRSEDALPLQLCVLEVEEQATLSPVIARYPSICAMWLSLKALTTFRSTMTRS